MEVITDRQFDGILQMIEMKKKRLNNQPAHQGRDEYYASSLYPIALILSSSYASLSFSTSYSGIYKHSGFLPLFPIPVREASLSLHK